MGDSELPVREQREPSLPQLRHLLRLTLFLKELTSTPASPVLGLRSSVLIFSVEPWTLWKNLSEMQKWTNLTSTRLFLLAVPLGFPRFRNFFRSFSVERSSTGQSILMRLLHTELLSKPLFSAVTSLKKFRTCFFLM